MLFCLNSRPLGSIYTVYQNDLISNQGHMMSQGEVKFYCLVVSYERSLLKSSIHDMTVRPVAVVEIKHPHLIFTLNPPDLNPWL